MRNGEKLRGDFFFAGGLLSPPPPSPPPPPPTHTPPHPPPPPPSPHPHRGLADHLGREGGERQQRLRQGRCPAPQYRAAIRPASGSHRFGARRAEPRRFRTLPAYRDSPPEDPSPGGSRLGFLPAHLARVPRPSSPA